MSDDPSTPLQFTVVIPTHDRPRALRSCLGALAAQRYSRAHFEVIVVDDGGEETAEPVVAEFRGELRLSLRRQARAGPGAARNQGAKSASGHYLAFLDDDCLAAPDWLSALETAFREHPRGALVGGDIANPFDDNLCLEVGELILRVLLERYQPERGGVYFFRTANLAISRDEFVAAGGFDPSFETAEDREFCDRWLDGGGRLVRASPATVLHASQLGFREFLRKHYRYGRGAYRFHRLRRLRGSGRFRLRFLGFYLFVAQACIASGRATARKLALVVLWQAANALGFLTELLSERRRQLWGASAS